MIIKDSDVKRLKTYLRRTRTPKAEIRLTVSRFILRRKNGDAKSYIKAAFV